MKKSDLKEISNLLDEKLDQKFDEKLRNFATKDDLNGIRDDLKQFATKNDLKQFATKDDLKQFATKDDLNASEERITISINSSYSELENKMNEKFDKNTEEHSRIFGKLDKIDNELLQRPTKEDIFSKWNNDIEQMHCDVDALKYIHKKEWKDLPNRSTIKNTLIKERM